MSFDWKGTLATVAPALASAIGSPVAGLAVSAGLTALGITPQAGNEEQQLAAAMQSATPDQMLALKQADQQFRKDMKALDIDLERIAGADRASARDMASKTGRRPQVVLSVVYTLAYAAALCLFLTGSVSFADSLHDLVLVLMGILTTAQTQILNFWFGSSSGSKEKTHLIGGKSGD